MVLQTPSGIIYTHKTLKIQFLKKQWGQPVDFSDRIAISLLIYRLLGKLRSGRQQQITVGDLEQMQESGNKIPRKQRRLWRI